MLYYNFIEMTITDENKSSTTSKGIHNDIELVDLRSDKTYRRIKNKSTTTLEFLFNDTD